MRSHEIASIFRKIYKNGPNFITPQVVRYGQVNRYIYELSFGKFMTLNLFGVTVLTVDGESTELSRSFASETEAEMWIEGLNNTEELI